MLGAARGHRIREGRDRRAVEAQGDAFHLDEDGIAGIVQTKVRPAVFHAVGHLTAQRGEAGQLAHHAIQQGFLDDAIGPPGVHAGQPALRRFADFPGTRQLAPRVVGTAEPDPAALAHAVEHGAGIRTVNGQALALWCFDIGEEALVAAQ
ncbi:hypothetical protein D3C78_1389080 [compost metagenome]